MNNAHSYVNKCFSLLSLNVCGLKGKLLSIEFIEEYKKYDIICMSENRCDDLDMNDVEVNMSNLFYDVVFRNRHALSRYKSGGTLITVRKDSWFQWKALPARADTLLSVQLDKCSLGFQKHLTITAVYVPPSNSRYGNIENLKT